MSTGEAWELFLHPSQRRLVEMAATGPVLVTCGPGTGKTVVALHRLRALLRRRPPGETRPLLLTTFSRVLCRQLEDGLRRLCRDEPGLLDGVIVKTLSQVARDVGAQAQQPATLLFGEVLDAAWAEALALDDAGRGRSFYEAERRDVVWPQGIVDETGYLKAKRVGRGARLERGARVAIWRVLSRFDAAVVARGGDDATGLAARAIRSLLAGTVASPCSGVVCDEVQDASLVDLRLLSLLGVANLFLVGDGHQRLYTKPVSLRGAGIEVRGRSLRLRLNYRTTQGICRAAVAHMEGITLDTLDIEAGEARADVAEDVGGYRSVRAGPLPERRVCENVDAEADVVARVIRASSPTTTSSSNGVVTPTTLVLCRTRVALEALQERLRTRGIVVAMLGDGDCASSLPTGVPPSAPRAPSPDATSPTPPAAGGGLAGCDRLCRSGAYPMGEGWCASRPSNHSRRSGWKGAPPRRRLRIMVRCGPVGPMPGGRRSPGSGSCASRRPGPTDTRPGARASTPGWGSWARHIARRTSRARMRGCASRRSRRCGSAGSVDPRRRRGRC